MKNPTKVSLVYLYIYPNKIFFLRNIDLQRNGLKVTLPHLNENAELVVTFLAYPGWKAIVNQTTLNNLTRKIYSKEDQFIRIKVVPEDKEVVFKFAPYNIFDFLLGPALSFLIFGIGDLVLTYFKNKQ